MSAYSLGVLLFILLVHFIGDFILQSDWMALNKSKSSWALFLHSMVYMAFLLCATWPLFGCFWFGLINGGAHGAIDAVTSKWTAWLWKRDQRHWFFVVIGLDQFIHTALLVTMFWLVVNI